MTSKSEAEIISSYSRDLFSGQTIRGISQALKKSYPHVHRHVHHLLDKNVMIKKIVGPSYLCFLNFRTEAGKLYAASTSLDLARKKIQQNKKLKPLVDALSKIDGDTVLVMNPEPIILYDEHFATIARKLAKRFSVGLSEFTKYVSDVASFPNKQLTILHGHYAFFNKLGELMKSNSKFGGEMFR